MTVSLLDSMTVSLPDIQRNDGKFTRQYDSESTRHTAEDGKFPRHYDSKSTRHTTE
jgi:hypothetical protein